MGVRLPPSALTIIPGHDVAVGRDGRRGRLIPVPIPIAMGMTTSYKDEIPAQPRARRGTGSLRERASGVWEIRVVVGFDPTHGHSVQRSFTVHGDSAWAQRRRGELVEDDGIERVGSSDIPGLNVAELLTRFMAGPHLWKPATYTSHRHVVDDLIADPLARRPLLTLTAGAVRAAIVRWQVCGVSVATVSARWLVLRSAISWAVTEGCAVEPAGRGARSAASTAPAASHPRRGASHAHRRRSRRGQVVRGLGGGPDVAVVATIGVQRRAGTAAGPGGRRLRCSPRGTRRAPSRRRRRAGADDPARRVTRRDRLDQDQPVAATDPRRDDGNADRVALVLVDGAGGRRRSTTGCSHPHQPGPRS